MGKKQMMVVDDAELEQLTIEELSALKETIEDEVRARIRAKQQAKAPQPITPKLAEIDLESARDAWLTTRRQGRAG